MVTDTGTPKYVMRLMIHRILLGWLASLLFFSNGVNSVIAGEKTILTFSVVPQLPQVTITHIWAPILTELSKKTGYEFRLDIKPGIPEFEAALLNGEPDIAYMNPYHAVKAMHAQKYNPLLRDVARELIGIVVVKKDSKIRTVKDLDGMTLVFPSYNAFGASLYIRALLTIQEGITFTPEYLRTHSNVYRSIYYGGKIAGGGVNKTLQKQSQTIRDGLKILYQTPGVAPHPVGIHPRIQKAVVDKLRSAFLELSKGEYGASLLKRVPIMTLGIANYQRDYEPLEKLHIEEFDKP